VRWFLTDGLSYRDLVAMMAERGVTLSHTILYVGLLPTAKSESS
jgi:transposase-like protein